MIADLQCTDWPVKQRLLLASFVLKRGTSDWNMIAKHMRVNLPDDDPNSDWMQPKVGVCGV
jgi:hypothetical protein